jgi:hypothetical protein
VTGSDGGLELELGGVSLTLITSSSTSLNFQYLSPFLSVLAEPKYFWSAIFKTKVLGLSLTLHNRIFTLLELGI